MIGFILVNGGSGSMDVKKALTFNKQLMTFTTEKAARNYKAVLENIGLEVKRLDYSKDFN